MPNLDSVFDVVLRYGRDKISVKVVDTATQLLINSLQTNTVGTTFPGNVGVYSSRNTPNNGAQFRSFTIVDVDRLSGVVPPTPLPPTPLPPTPPPTTTTPRSTTATTTAPPAIPVCDVSAWSSWSYCSKNCSSMQPGSQQRTRFVVRDTSSGSLCPLLIERQSCDECIPICSCVGCDKIGVTGSDTWCKCCKLIDDPMCSSIAQCQVCKEAMLY